MHAKTSAHTAVPARRRRSSASDPLRKMTLQLSKSVVEAIKAVVQTGDAPSANVFVEDAVRAELHARRRAKIYAAYEEASRDPQFMRDMNADRDAFDSTLTDGLARSR